jgi:hypothetical protein
MHFRGLALGTGLVHDEKERYVCNVSWGSNAYKRVCLGEKGGYFAARGRDEKVDKPEGTHLAP